VCDRFRCDFLGVSFTARHSLRIVFAVILSLNSIPTQNGAAGVSYIFGHQLRPFLSVYSVELKPPRTPPLR